MCYFYHKACFQSLWKWNSLFLIKSRLHSLKCTLPRMENVVKLRKEQFYIGPVCYYMIRVQLMMWRDWGHPIVIWNFMYLKPILRKSYLHIRSVYSHTYWVRPSEQNQQYRHQHDHSLIQFLECVLTNVKVNLHYSRHLWGPKWNSFSWWSCQRTNYLANWIMHISASSHCPPAQWWHEEGYFSLPNWCYLCKILRSIKKP